MAILYPVLWPQRNGDMPQDVETGELTVAGEVWRDVLAGVGAEQIRLGLQRCVLRASEFPPQPQEFRALCLGIPSLAEVRLALWDECAIKPPFVVLMFQHLDYYNWKMADQRSADRMLQDAYAVAREHVLLGGALPDPPAGVLTAETRAPKPASREVAERVLQEAREAFAPDDDSPVAGKDAAAGPDA